MKLIKPYYNILKQNPGLEGIYEAIETAGRLCYKSTRPEGKTAKDFVDMLIKRKHYAMLEHGTIYLLFSECCYDNSDRKFIDKYTRNPYSKVVCMGSDDDLVEETPDKIVYSGDIWGTGVSGDTVYAITTNYRVLIENQWLDDLKYLCEPTGFHEKRIMVHFVTSIGIVRELLRHRKFSFANESTRYCNYSRNQFNNEIQCIIPSWCKGMIEGNKYDWELVTDYDLRQTEDLSEAETRLIASWCYDEVQYMSLLNKCILNPQQAREVLPLTTKSELIMTGFKSDWAEMFSLRVKGTTGKPHPDCKNLIEPVYKKFIENEWINE